ncbi:hypothetical protein [Nocardia sp. alder85J]|uniref:hypothetical protein n=1 Tax=Nocardia sp. alder85J TaxID=2862949 RepID=UPI001CD3DAD0|nr:hypothetical protein [Nocardia sp. alder85J]MCX4099116.1 hypothetical protein [Nocardia sp. alder85J]
MGDISVILERMCELFDRLAVGDRIAWWTDLGGRGTDPGQPGAHRSIGTVTDMERDAAGAVTVCFVDITTSMGGVWNTTIRPDLGHRPEPA